MKYEDVKRTMTDKSPVSEYKDEHPAFGQIIVSRVSRGGSTSLYGASSTYHPTTIRLQIKRSERCHNLGRDQFFGHENVVEVEMTALQFADMLTHMNIGEGVPCTLRHVGMESVPYIPVEDDTEIGRIKDAFEDEISARLSAESIREARSELKEILGKKTLLKADRERIASLTGKMIEAVESLAPFMLKQFSESAEKVQAEVKKEVRAFTDLVVNNAGMQKLAEITMGAEMQLPGEVDDVGDDG